MQPPSPPPPSPPQCFDDIKDINEFHKWSSTVDDHTFFNECHDSWLGRTERATRAEVFALQNDIRDVRHELENCLLTHENILAKFEERFSKFEERLDNVAAFIGGISQMDFFSRYLKSGGLDIRKAQEAISSDNNRFKVTPN